jgi:hypothetical protein
MSSRCSRLGRPFADKVQFTGMKNVFLQTNGRKTGMSGNVNSFSEGAEFTGDMAAFALLTKPSLMHVIIFVATDT